MRNKLVAVFSIALLVCCIISAGTAFADQVNVLPPSNYVNSSNPGNPVYGALNVANYGDIAGTFTYGGYVGPVYANYQFQFNLNSSATGYAYTETNSFCVDPAGDNGNNKYYINSLSSLPVSDSYREAAWIADQYITGNATKLEAQAAIWEIVFGTNPSQLPAFVYTGSDGNVANLVSGASNGYKNLNLNGFYLATSPDNGISGSYEVSNQDCLFYVQPVPESPSFFLAGFTLLGFVMFRRRKAAKKLV